MPRVVRLFDMGAPEQPTCPRCLGDGLDAGLRAAINEVIEEAAALARLSRADFLARGCPLEAAKQSKHYYLPALDEPQSFETILTIPAKSRIVFAESGGGPLKADSGGVLAF